MVANQQQQLTCTDIYQLSFKGRQLARRILESPEIEAMTNNEERNLFLSFKAARIFYKDDPQEFEKLKQKQGHYSNWTEFAPNLSPETWRDFFAGNLVRAFSIRCQVMHELNEAISFIPDDVKSHDPRSYFRECRDEMNSLRTSMRHRLMIPLTELHKHDAKYSELLRLKNKDFEDDPVKIPQDALNFDNPKSSEEIFEIELFAKVCNKDHAPKSIMWGCAMVHIPTGRSELLLDYRPYMWAGEEVKIGRKKIRGLKLLEKKSLTFCAIQLLEEAYSEHHKRKIITNFGGWLKDSNLSRFRGKYVELRKSNPHLKPEEIAYEAYAHTSFGRGRIEHGITERNIHILSYDDDDIPSRVLVYEARRPEK